MKAVVRRGHSLALDEVPEPVPGIGQALVKTLACGICGSDLHALHGLDVFADGCRRSGVGDAIDAGRDMIFGHEFCAEILEHGPETNGRFKSGTRVVSMPFVEIDGRIEWVGISNNTPGGFAQRMILSESLLLEVPNGLPTQHAALIEPMAVGEHAVVMADVPTDAVCLVIGSGPVGLAVIAALKRRGLGPVIVADFSPTRRRVAEIMGADEVIDPTVGSPHMRWETHGVAPTLLASSEWLAAQRRSRPAVTFDCVGAPGLLRSLVEQVPPTSQIVAVGACMEADVIEPVIALNKQLLIRFVCAYTADEFQQTLHNVSEGILDVAPLISDVIGLGQVACAFERLALPNTDVKVLVEPWRQ